jgi:hypothetical protein
MDIYTQAVTAAKREAQAAVLSLVFSPEGDEVFAAERNRPQDKPSGRSD